MRRRAPTCSCNCRLRVSSAASRPGVYAPVIANIYSANQQALSSHLSRHNGPRFNRCNWLTRAGPRRCRRCRAHRGNWRSDFFRGGTCGSSERNFAPDAADLERCYMPLRARRARRCPSIGWPGPSSCSGVGTVDPNAEPGRACPIGTRQDYVSRQQMQMLVDWLFQQIDATNCGCRRLHERRGARGDSAGQRRSGQCRD